MPGMDVDRLKICEEQLHVICSSHYIKYFKERKTRKTKT